MHRPLLRLARPVPFLHLQVGSFAFNTRIRVPVSIECDSIFDLQHIYSCVRFSANIVLRSLLRSIGLTESKNGAHGPSDGGCCECGVVKLNYVRIARINVRSTGRSTLLDLLRQLGVENWIVDTIWKNWQSIYLNRSMSQWSLIHVCVYYVYGVLPRNKVRLFSLEFPTAIWLIVLAFSFTQCIPLRDIMFELRSCSQLRVVSHSWLHPFRH